MLLAACGVVFDAPKITLQVREDGIMFAEADGVSKLVGGETVLIVRNASPRERQIVLAEVPDGGPDIPLELLEAERARDDARILGFSPILEAETADFASGGGGRVTDEARFHIYLAPGRDYVLFDRLALGRPEAVLWLRPIEVAR